MAEEIKYDTLLQNMRIEEPTQVEITDIRIANAWIKLLEKGHSDPNHQKHVLEAEQALLQMTDKKAIKLLRGILDR